MTARKPRAIALRWPAALVLGLVVLAGRVQDGRATCIGYPDLPGCTCYSGSVAWPLSGIAGDVVATGEAQVGVESSCLRHRGQPYWQIQLQLATPLMAEFYGAWYSLGYSDIVSHYPEEAWCTEAVAFWHREAAVPYADGYSSSVWHPSSYVQNVSSLRTWYITEELLAPGGMGRGRWVKGGQLDYSDFRPGINAPCPGAYQALWAYEPGSGTWPSTSCTHSQVVDSVVIHHSGSLGGPIESVDVLVVEGNAGGGTFTDIFGATGVSRGVVQRSRWYFDVLQYTANGSSSIGPCASTSSTAQWKIRGWGIDRHSGGSSYCDESRIREDVVAAAPSRTLATVPARVRVAASDPDSEMAVAIHDYVLSRGGPIAVVANTQAIVASGLPTAATPWIIPPAPLDVDTAWIEVDLRANHPLSIRGAVVEWKDGAVPEHYQVRWAAEGAPFHVAAVHLPPPQAMTGALPIITRDSLSQVVRRLRFVFPAGELVQEYRVTGVHLLFDYGGPEDGGNVFNSPPTAGVGRPAATPGLALQASPNPFHERARITLLGEGAGVTEIAVSDVGGRRVRDLGRVVAGPGPRVVDWDGRDDAGRSVPPGVYVVRARGVAGEARVSVVRFP